MNYSYNNSSIIKDIFVTILLYKFLLSDPSFFALKVLRLLLTRKLLHMQIQGCIKENLHNVE